MNPQGAQAPYRVGRGALRPTLDVMSPRPYRFRGEYRIAAPCSPVVAGLRDADHWPTWWPQIRAVVRHSDTTGLVTIRSLLPVTLRLTVTGEVDDPDAGVLRARIGGDLDGWIEFGVDCGEHDGAARVTYAQECGVSKPGLARASALLRPLLRANHAAMMRSGMRGLETYACRHGGE